MFLRYNLCTPLWVQCADADCRVSSGVQIVGSADARCARHWFSELPVVCGGTVITDRGRGTIVGGTLAGHCSQTIMYISYSNYPIS